MKKFLTDLKSSFWFVPSVMVLGSIALAFAAIELDLAVGAEALARFPRLFGARAEGSRQLVAAIASSTMTVAGVVFSITIVALSLTAAQYSPRVLRNFMSDRANQLVLGVFVGVYVYCILVLRTVRGGEDAFVPGISVLIAIALAIVGIGFLIFFIHHIATSIQVSEIAARVARETIKSIRDAAQAERSGESPGDFKALAAESTWSGVPASRSGYIQQVHTDTLILCASRSGRLLRMEKAVGAFVIKGERLLSASGSAPLPEPMRARLNDAYILNTYRDLAQDPAFGVEQLVDIALRALSPGVNDTGTARNALNYIAEILCELALCGHGDDRYCMHEGKLVLIKRTQTFSDLMQSALGSIRRNSVQNLDMALPMLDTIASVALATRTPDARNAVMQELAALEESLNGSVMVSADKLTIDAALHETFAFIGAEPLR